MANKLILSLFPGVDLFSKPFTQSGFCVVKAPDIAFGEDIRDFACTADVFEGIIAGSPCQDYSLLNRENPTGEGLQMINEFKRCVIESNCDWFLHENVPTVPNIKIKGYKVQRFNLDLGWFDQHTRLRTFHFGSKNGKLLNPPKLSLRDNIVGGCVTASNDKRNFRHMCDIQGLPVDYDLPLFSLEGKKKMVGNGVPIRLGIELVKMILRDYYNENIETPAQVVKKRCKCGCGRAVTGRRIYFDGTCRVRNFRAKDKVIRTTPVDINNYLGSKSAAGLKETIINLIPPHLTYIEGFLGSGVIMKSKRAALQNIGVELNQSLLDQFNPSFDVTKLCTDSYKFIKSYPFNGTEFIYLDPPYLIETRSSNIRYEYEYSKSDHKRLLDIILKIKSNILISGYASELYDEKLKGWNRKEVKVMSRGGPRVEVLWWNYDHNILHETKYTGKNKTERQAIKRKKNRWQSKFATLQLDQQQALLESMIKSYQNTTTKGSK